MSGFLIAAGGVALVTARPNGSASASAAKAVLRSAPPAAPALEDERSPSEPTLHSVPDRPERVSARAETRHENRYTAPSASDASARSRVDSRLDADLRILEEDAARRAESIGLATDTGVPTPKQAPDRAADDARRIALADAFLVEHFVRDAYRGTVFPIGYPAEQRTREAATSLVSSFGPAQRSAQLEVALQAASTEPIGPSFEPEGSDLIWQAALP